jgi:hypothetical protein
VSAGFYLLFVIDERDLPNLGRFIRIAERR